MRSPSPLRRSFLIRLVTNNVQPLPWKAAMIFGGPKDSRIKPRHKHVLRQIPAIWLWTTYVKP